LIEHFEFDEEDAKVSNVKVFQSLQTHPTWSIFFCTFNNGRIHNASELEVGQAKFFQAHVTWKDPKFDSEHQKYEVKHMFKVFQKGNFLRDLQKQWPLGMFQQYIEIAECLKRRQFDPRRYTSGMHCGTLLPDGRFVFLLVKENEDLRTLIDRCMKARACIDCRPFSRKMSRD